MKIRINYIKWQLRFALGETESTDAVSQNVRLLIYRSDDQYEDLIANSITPPTDDHDGNVDYSKLYGQQRGLYLDDVFYLMSQAADSDTTVGGQYISKGFKRMKYDDTYQINSAQTSSTDFVSEKGQLCMTVMSDDPTGTNGKIYGYFELGFQYLND